MNLQLNDKNMKYLKNNSGTLFIKDFGNGHCVSIHLNQEISYEKKIHYEGIVLLESTQLEVQKAFSATVVKLMNTYHETEEQDLVKVEPKADYSIDLRHNHKQNII